MVLFRKELYSREVCRMQRKRIHSSLFSIVMRCLIKNILLGTAIFIIVFQFSNAGFTEVNDKSVEGKTELIDEASNEEKGKDQLEGTKAEQVEVPVKEIETEAIEKKEPPKKTADVSVKKEIKQVKKDSAIPVKKKEEPVKRPAYGNGLLNITEGDFKYSRIPGIEISSDKDDDDNDNIKEEIVITSEEISIDSVPEEIPPEENEGEGIFGLDKETGDTVLILIFLLIIIGVIILLKIKSKYRGDSVLRRFPGS